MSTTTTFNFTVDRLPDVPYGEVPAEAADSPFADEAAEYLRLRDEHAAAVTKLHEVAAKAPSAKRADEQARSTRSRRRSTTSSPTPADSSTASPSPQTRRMTA
jgi:hypothetical protein